MVLAVADTGVTHHMIPDKSAFISCNRVDKQVRMGNRAYVPVFGWGTAVFALNGHTVLIRNVLHVPALRVPLYSLCAHLKQRGCGFVGDNSLGGMCVYFPSFFISVDISEDCHLRFRSLGDTASLKKVEYGRPRSEASASRVTTRSQSRQAAGAIQAPGIIRNASSEPDAAVPPVASPQPAKAIWWQQPVSVNAAPGPRAREAHPRALPRGDGGVKLLSALSPEEVRQYLHRPGTEPPPLRPCDMLCDSDKKVRWSAEEIHLATRARKFKNYQHLLQCTKSGEWVNVGEFPASLGSHISIPGAKRGKLIDRHLNKYLDVVHLDIGFGNTVSVVGATLISPNLKSKK